MKISEAAASGDARTLLVAMRDLVARKLDEDPHPRDVPPLTKRLREIAEDIRLLDAESEGDRVGAAAATPDIPWAAAS